MATTRGEVLRVVQRAGVRVDAGGYVEGGSNLVGYARGRYKVRDED